SVGIKTKVDGGKISVIKDTVVAKEGEVIDAKKASVLSRLDIKPMPIGLNMTAAWEGGVIYAKSILAVDEQEYLNNIKIGHLNAFALAMHVGHPAPEVVRANITKAQRISVGIALHCAIPTKDTIGILMARAVAHANAVNAHV
ncbi:50S ribosomal protein L10, partial [Candidatus Woesearchaeota archaeon CG_4_10_14_0_2_um_filter_57_5]